jgi:hypothetical protein
MENQVEPSEAKNSSDIEKEQIKTYSEEQEKKVEEIEDEELPSLVSSETALISVDEKSVLNTTDSISTSENKKLPSPFILSVEGLPGVDKENFFNLCVIPVMEEFGMKTIFIQEPTTNCEKTQILASQDPRRWLYSYNMSILRDKFSLYKSAFEHSKNGGQEAILLEKSLLGDNIYAQAQLELENITEVEMEEINKWHELCNLTYFIKPHLCFHLKSDMQMLENKVKEELHGEGTASYMKFFETLELMHSVNFKIMSKNSIKTVTIRDMELFMKSELIKNRIMFEVREAIVKHEFLKDRVK